MTILQLTADYFGSSIYKHLFDSLSQKQVESTIFVSSNEKAPASLPTNVMVSDRHYTPLDRFLYYKKQRHLYQELETHHLTQGVQLTHSHTLFSNGRLAMQLQQRYGIPYIVAVRNTDINVFFRYMMWLRRVGIQVLQYASAIICLSDAYKTQLLRYIPSSHRDIIASKIHLIPNGIDAFFLQNRLSQPKRHPSPRTLHLLYVGRIDANKNLETSLRVCQTLIDKGYAVTFTVIGPIADTRYERLLPQYDFVRYLPSMSKQDLLPYYREADIFLMPSFHETFGLVYAEALTQGIPVIYTRGQGFDLQFPDGHVGYAVPPTDTTAITQAILSILDNYELFSHHALEASVQFDWEAIAQQYIQLYTIITTKTTPQAI